MSLYKVIHRESGLFWKGSSINKNNKSFKHIQVKNTESKIEFIPVNYKSEEHALKICFSKTGKTWSSLRAVKSALGYGHEEGLNSLLTKCELVEIKEVEV